jgi:hypothetical protein
MKKLLLLCAVSEAATGAALLIAPSLVAQWLFGDEATGVAIPLARVAGISLIALAAACFPDRSIRRAFSGMLTYSVLAMLYLVYVGVSSRAGTLLWPGVAVHAVLSVLLIRSWRQERRAPEAST